MDFSPRLTPIQKRFVALFCLFLAGVASVWHLAPSQESPSKKAISAVTPERSATQVLKVPEAITQRLTPDQELLAEGRVTLPVTAGMNRRYRVSLDELYEQTPGNAGTRKIEMCADAQQLLAVAEREAARQGSWPGLVLYPEDGPSKPEARRILTGRLLVTLRQEAVEPALGSAGLRVLERPEYSPRHLVVQSLSGSPMEALKGLSNLQNDPRLLEVTPLLKRHVKPAAAPNDPFYPRQWHLENTGQGKGRKGFDIKVKDVWDQFQGEGIRIAIVDDGLQRFHPDLAPNVDPDSSHHYNWLAGNNESLRYDPTPDAAKFDFHGTSVAGVAAARGGNGLGVSGVAPRAMLIGQRFLDTTVALDDGDIADLVIRGTGFIDVKNNSWGFGEYYAGVAEVGSLFLAAMEESATNARGGRGVFSIWAAGNGRAAYYQGNKNGLANTIYGIAVGAMTNTGTLAAYSETGAHLCVVAPSSGGTLDVATSDLVGAVGYNPDPEIPDIEEAEYNYTGTFGGTSSAAPVVSGVVALMLEANPNLRLRDVKEIFLRSSLQVDPTSATWMKRSTRGQPNLPPIKHSNLYGGGLIQAKAAVDMARQWTNLPAQISVSRFIEPKVAVNFENDPKKGVQETTPLSSILKFPEPKKAKTMRQTFDFRDAAPIQLEHVTVTLNLSHTYRGDLTINLRSPSGVVSSLAAATLYDAGQDYAGFTFSSMRHWGESGQGLWTLEITDTYDEDDGFLESATVSLFGVSVPGPNIVSQSSTQLLAEGSAQNLEVVSNGPEDMKRSWRKDGKVIPKQTGMVLPFTSLKLTDGGTYDHVMTSFFGTLASPPIKVGVVRRSISPVAAKEGAPAVIKAITAGPGLRYQWLRGSSLTPLIANGRVVNVNTSTLTIRELRATDEDTYVCRVSTPSSIKDAPPLVVDTLPMNLMVLRKPSILPGQFSTPGIVSGNEARQVLASNVVTRYTITGLPGGMSYNPATGIISGSPNAAGRYLITITASNVMGTSDPVSFIWDVLPLPEGIPGTFHGLVDRHSSFNASFGGSLTLTVTNSGSYTGTLTRGIHRHTFTGRITAGDTITGQVTLPRAAPYAPLTFSFQIQPETLTGTISEPNSDIAAAGVVARRAAYSSTSPGYAYAGRWNTAYELPEPLIGDPAYPQGASWGTQTVSPSGVAIWSGRLADGTTLTASSGISAGGQTALHFMLNSFFGSMQGWQTLYPETGSSSAALTWMKTAVNSRSYSSGIPLHDLIGSGSLYTPPLSQEMLFGIPLVADNARFNFSQGGLATPFLQSFTLATGNVIVMPTGSANPHQIQALLDLATGILTGSGNALDIDPSNPGLNRQRAGTFSALVIPAQEKAIGHFLLPTSQSSSAPILSGKLVGEETTN